MRLAEDVVYRPAPEGTVCGMCSWAADGHIAEPVHQTTGETGEYVCPFCAKAMNIRMENCKEDLIPIYLPEMSQRELNTVLISAAYIHTTADQMLQSPVGKLTQEERATIEAVKTVAGMLPAGIRQRSIRLTELLMADKQFRANIEQDVNLAAFDLLLQDLKVQVKKPTWLVDLFLMCGPQKDLDLQLLGGARLFIQTSGLLTQHPAPGAKNHEIVFSVANQKTPPADFMACVRLFTGEGKKAVEGYLAQIKQHMEGEGKKAL